MACPHTIDQQLGVFDRTRVWMSLRLLYGLDLSDFLVGTRHAYHVVHDLVRDGEWDALEPLMQPACLEAVSDFEPQAAGQPADTINILSAVLTDARLLEPSDEESIAPGTAHLDVRFSALQGLTLHDLQSGAAPLAAPRLQESTWTFEGVVRPWARDEAAGAMRADAPPPTAAAGNAADNAAARDEAAAADGARADDDWRVVNIEWSVWEVHQNKQELPGWPTHGP